MALHLFLITFIVPKVEKTVKIEPLPKSETYASKGELYGSILLLLQGASTLEEVLLLLSHLSREV